MIAHDAFRQLAARAIDAPLSPAELAELAGHRTECRTCARYEAALKADALALEAMPGIRPSAAIEARILTAIDGRQRFGQLSPLMVVVLTALVMAAALGATLAVGTLLRREEERLPPRPAVPNTWSLALAYSRDVRVALPPYVVPTYFDNSVLANEAPAGRNIWLEVHAIGPAGVDQPAVGQTLSDWLESRAPDQARGATQIRSLALPAGLSVELRTIYAPGTPQESHARLYAIETADGVAYLQIIGGPDDFANHATDIDLIPMLMEAGPMLSAAIGPAPPALEPLFDLPAGWSYQHGPIGPRQATEFIGFISNRPIPSQLCHLDIAGDQACQPHELELADDAFLVSIMQSREGGPRNPPTGLNLAPGVVAVTAFGLPATRTIEPDSDADGRRVVIWELYAPEGHSSYLIIQLNVGQAHLEAVLDEVQLLLDDAAFAEAG